MPAQNVTERERIEDKLSSLPELRTELRNLRGKVRRFKRKIARQEYTLSAVDYSLISQGKTGRVVQRQQEWVARHLDRFPELLKLINELDQVKSKVSDIEAALENLRSVSEEQYQFVRRFYLEQYTMTDTVQILGISRSKGYTLRSRVVDFFLSAGW